MFSSERNIRNLKAAAIIAFVMIILVSAISSACVFAEDSSASDAKYTSIDELKGKRIASQTGTIFDGIINEKIPGAEVVFFTTFPDEVNALKASKVDALACSATAYKLAQKQDDSIVALEESIGEIECAYLYPKTEKGLALSEQMNEYLKNIRESGEIDEIAEKWFGDDDSVKTMEDYRSLPADNGTLVFITEGTFAPYDYFKDGVLVGYDVDMAVRFCKEYGYGIKVKDMNFDAMIPALQSGKADFAASGIAVTEERKQKVYFSEPNYYESVNLVVLRNKKGGGSFISSIKNSFRKTFIEEGRYKLFLKGIITTLNITILSIIFGTVLGFLMYLWCRRGVKAANYISSFSVWLIQGMPGIVLLMMLYYVIFGKVSISGMWVAVIGFTLTFAASVYSMILAGVNAVDFGQTEASYALGFNDRETFFGIILPQAAWHFMPAYRAEMVSLIKATAIVGYIAVEDLTKMGDIIRSRTYEAFFPLISIAIIYFILAGILKWIVNRVTASVDPQSRSDEQILKGVKVR